MKNNQMIFKNQETAKAFWDWVQKFGVTHNPCDVERFYDFVHVYYLNKEKVKKEDFVKACKHYTHTTQRENRGICQLYYNKLCAIVEYLKIRHE